MIANATVDYTLHSTQQQDVIRDSYILQRPLHMVSGCNNKDQQTKQNVYYAVTFERIRRCLQLTMTYHNRATSNGSRCFF